MDLFTTNNQLRNVLPYDGVVHYYGPVLSLTEANRYHDALLHTVAWKNDEAIIFGRHIITKRKVAWYGDFHYQYTYSNITKQALPWTPELMELKQLVENLTGNTFNSCLLNLYHTGNEGMAWHSDDEKALGHHSAIASVSLGAARRFAFKHKKNKETIYLLLDPGSLLVMKDTTQSHWLHALPKTKKVIRPRINLTFRTMVG